MCGLVGIVDLGGRREPDRAVLERMNAVQHHRGPDESDTHFAAGVALGHRRLSIIDLATGQQPMSNDDGSVVIVYNGEVYNFAELRAELETLGRAFRTHSDTEVILRAWEAWGEASVKRLRGMFAYALWDANREVLFLARDRLGIKPLHYAWLADGTLAFASELKSLYAHPGVPRELDPRAVEDYFALGYVPDPKTILRGVHKLAPGHTLTARRGAAPCEPREYWDLSFARREAPAADELEGELLERLDEAVRIRLISEVPLGAFLSGGVDSSAVVDSMARALESPVNTCSISFGDPRFDESRYALQVAADLGTNHRSRAVEAEDFDLIDRLAQTYDEPYADSSALPTYRLCELAREHVTVALSGDGGDENFAGYRRYRWHLLEERARAVLPQSIRGPLFGALGAAYPKADWAPRFLRAKYTLQGIARDSMAGYLHSVGVVPEDMRRRLFSASLNRDLQGYSAVEVFRHHARRAPTDHPLSLVQYVDFKTYLPGDILTKVDRASMAHSLEVRVPILDHQFVDWVSTLAPDLKLQGSEGKHVFKRALESRLTREVLYRPKQGFSIPLARWFRGPLRERARTALTGEPFAASGLFEPGRVGEILDQHESGLRDHGSVIWTLLAFAAFQRNALGLT